MTSTTPTEPEALAAQLTKALVDRDEMHFKTVAFVNRHAIIAALSAPAARMPAGEVAQDLRGALEAIANGVAPREGYARVDLSAVECRRLARKALAHSPAEPEEFPGQLQKLYDALSNEVLKEQDGSLWCSLCRQDAGGDGLRHHVHCALYQPRVGDCPEQRAERADTAFAISKRRYEHAKTGDAAFCNKCGYHGPVDQHGQHTRPKDGQPCNYMASRASLSLTALAQPAENAKAGEAVADVMIGNFIAQYDEGAAGCMMDADDAQALAREFKRMQGLIYCPGVLRCAKCDFRLIKTTLTPAGAFANEEPDRCPNCDVPLWRVTWQDEAKDAYKTAESQMNRALEAERKFAHPPAAEPVGLREAWSDIDRLRADEGDSVTILCDNPGDFDMSYNVAIDCNGGWTGWVDRRFTGQSVADCLRQAAKARADVGDNHPEYKPTCDVPPDGWRCSREPGHSGPCAATPARTDDAGVGAENRPELMAVAQAIQNEANPGFGISDLAWRQAKAAIDAISPAPDRGEVRP